MFIPLGHSQSVFSWPYATFSIMAACLAAHIYTVAVEPSEDELNTLLESRAAVGEQLTDVVTAQVLGAMATEIGEDGSTAMMRASSPEALLIELEMLDDQIEAWANKDLSYRWAFHVWDRASVTWFMYAFAHGGWLHLLFNLLFLWLAGSAIEDRWGRILFVLFYLGGAAAAAFVFKLFNPAAAGGLIGASGAVAAAMGAFFVCCYRSQIRILFVGYLPGRGFRASRFWLPTYVALPVWFVAELFWSWYEAEGLVSGTAHSAHIGGFGLGVAVALALKLTRVEGKFLLREEHLEDAPDRGKGAAELKRAEQLLASGSYSTAVDCLTRLLERDPAQVEAKVKLVEIGLSMHDRRVVGDHFGAAVSHLVLQNDHDKLADLLTKGVPIGLHENLPERVCAQCARMMLARDPPDIASTLVSELHRTCPTSAFLPRLLWSVSEQQGARRDLAGQREALTILAEQFPVDPFGQQASRALTNLPSPAPSQLAAAQTGGVKRSTPDALDAGVGPSAAHGGLDLSLADDPSPGQAGAAPGNTAQPSLPPAHPGGAELLPPAHAGSLELSTDDAGLELSTDAAGLKLELATLEGGDPTTDHGGLELSTVDDKE